MDRCCIVVAVLFLIVCTSWAGYPYNRRNNPLQGDDGRKSLRATECHFGKTIRELGSSWFADLGPPFGVMYCIRCECVPVQKKRRIVAKVQCRNIKHECPKPTCDEPVLLPGRCCKLCPSDLSGSELARDVPITEEDKNMKHFGALLTPRSSLIFKRDDIINIPSTSDKPAYQIVATGRFTFHKKNLYFSFYLANSLNQIPPRPRTIQFINYKGDLLEEQSLTTSEYQNATGKVCGVWQRLPRDYKRLLRDEALYVALLWENDLALSGKIARFKALFSEHFTALMTPPSSSIVPPDGGGTAIISLSSLAATNSVHMALVFNGVFAPSDVSDVPLSVRLEDNEQIIHEEIIRVTKPSTELNFEEVRFTLSTADLRHLTRGKAFVTISSKSHPDLMFVRGPILSRATCEIFQSPLSPSTDDQQNSQADADLRSGAAGLAWMYMTRDGSLAYNWEIEGAGTEVSVAITHGKGKIIQAFNSTNPGSNASGILDRLPPRSVELLYAGELAVRANGEYSLLRGQLIPRPVAGPIDSRRPILLTSSSTSNPPPAGLVGLAWMNVDLDCNLHYEVQLSGASEASSYRLYLEDTPMMIPNAPVTRRLLDDFNGTLLEGFNHMPPHELAKIGSGVSFMEIVDFNTERLFLRGNLKSLRIPPDCLAGIGDNTVPSISSPSDPSYPLQSAESKCFHERAFYNEGSQWRHARDPCRMCHCLRGKEHCDQVVCPPLHCANPVKISKDQCCPSCANNTADVNLSHGCNLGQLVYPAGSSWHPYLPPNGFDLCVVVSCEATTLSLKYRRIKCPTLTCPQKDQIRPSKNACCQICATPDVTLAGDEPAHVITKWRTDEDILQAGGCTYVGRGPFENNSNWTHSIPSIGLTPCVKCHCRDGRVTCERKRCPRTQCSNHTIQSLTAAPGSNADECCSSQCRRYRRQSRHRKTAPGGKKI